MDFKRQFAVMLIWRLLHPVKRKSECNITTHGPGVSLNRNIYAAYACILKMKQKCLNVQNFWKFKWTVRKLRKNW